MIIVIAAKEKYRIDEKIYTGNKFNSFTVKFYSKTTSQKIKNIYIEMINHFQES
jgi:hypothetical protein